MLMHEILERQVDAVTRSALISSTTTKFPELNQRPTGLRGLSTSVTFALGSGEANGFIRELLVHDYPGFSDALVRIHSYANK
jgi:hypothetical protein